MRVLSALFITGIFSLMGIEGICEDLGPEKYMAPYKVDPYSSTYVAPLQARPILIVNGTVLTGNGQQLEGVSLLVVDGKIRTIGNGLDIEKDTIIIDAKGKWITPGIIDVHSHLGLEPSPQNVYNSDVNEFTGPVKAEIWAEHAVWPQDARFIRALAGGVTTLQILPGSANLFGGRSVTVKNVHTTTRSAMKFPGAPHGLKMACGENPRSVYSKKGGPGTRMAMMAGYRKMWIKAVAYKKSWDQYAADKNAGTEKQMPKRDLQLDTLAGVLSGNIKVHTHCYRAEEMASMVQLSHEFGYKISAFHHAVESYKITEILKAEGICAAMWADWWGFKLEAFDGIDENVAMVAHAGACAIIHSDSAQNIQRLNIDAARAWADGRAAGLEFSKAEAFGWLSLNPAKALGIADQTGSLEVGKMADIVIWSGDPFDVYTRADIVLVDGIFLYEREDPVTHKQSDFETGLNGRGTFQ